jgi:hypothetical protein
LHSIWLLPSAKGSACFCELISRLSRQWHGPVFKPHLTVLGDLSGSIDSSITHCSAIFSDLNAQRVRVTGVDSTEQFFMSLYLDISLPQSFVNARRQLADLFQPQSSDNFRPHISLAYGPVGGADKSGLISRIAADLVGFEFELTSAQVVKSANHIPVAQWQTLWQHDLDAS